MAINNYRCFWHLAQPRTADMSVHNVQSKPTWNKLVGKTGNCCLKWRCGWFQVTSAELEVYPGLVRWFVSISSLAVSISLSSVIKIWCLRKHRQWEADPGTVTSPNLDTQQPRALMSCDKHVGGRSPAFGQRGWSQLKEVAGVGVC